MQINAVSYARFSSNKQTEASIEIQQEHINRYCKDNGITIIKEYVDRAFSALSDNRPQFQQMIRDSDSGLFTYVIVYNSSRFCRNIQDHLKYRAILESNGVRIICVNENFDESTPEGDLMSNFMMSINQYYSRDLGRKTYLGCLEKARECKHCGGVAPYGYDVDKDKRYIINEEEAKVVRLIFQMVDDGKSNSEITAKLDSLGIRKRSGVKFNNSYSELLRNRKYIGEYTWNKTKRSPVTGKVVSNTLYRDSEIVRIPNGMPAIISEEQFIRVQKMLDERRTSGNSKPTSDYFLSSMLKCGYCGYRISVDRNVNGNGRGNWTRLDYKCYSRNKKRADCVAKPIKMSYLDTYILNLLKGVLFNERYTKSICKLIRNKVGGDYENDKKLLQSNIESQIKIRSDIQALVSSLAEAKPIVYQEIIAEIERKKVQLLDLENEASIKKASMEEYPYIDEESICQRILKMKSAITDKSMSEIRQIMRLVIKEIIVTNEEIEVIINLNAYIKTKSKVALDVSIIEETENIKIPENHLKQKLTWNSLIIRL